MLNAVCPPTFRSLVALGLIAVTAASPVLVRAGAAPNDRYQIAVRPNAGVEVIAPDGGRAVFTPDMAILRTSEDPNLEMRWGKFKQTELHLSDTGSVYNVLTWGPKSAASATARHVEDGFDPNSDRGYGAGRTADMFAAGRLERVRGTGRSIRDGKIGW